MGNIDQHIELSEMAAGGQGNTFMTEAKLGSSTMQPTAGATAQANPTDI